MEITINRESNTSEVIAFIKQNYPAIKDNLYIVGRWVWANFETKPDESIREFLKSAGFRYNGKRQVWQHCCGLHSRRAPYDPRKKYKTFSIDDTQLS